MRQITLPERIGHFYDNKLLLDIVWKTCTSDLPGK